MFKGNRKQSRLCEVSPVEERRSMVGRICEKGRFWAWSERVKELCIMKVVK